FLGQLALGHAGFMSVGAYASTLFVRYATGIPENVRFIASLLLGALVAAVVGLIVGIPALRLKGDYLAIITLGFGEIIRVIIENLGFTGGAQGLTKIPQLTSFTIVYIIVIITLVVLYSFIRSRHGRAVMAIREDSIAAESCGINITFYRTLAFTLSAAFAGIAGGLYAHQVGVLSAKVFGFNKSIEYVVMVVLGGMGSFTGSIVSAITLTILPEALRSFSQYRMLIYSLALILMMIFKPSGLLGTYEFSLTRFWGKLTGKIPREVKVKKENGKIVSFLIKIKEKILASKKVKTDTKTQNDNGDNLEQGDKK
ncbi:MAG: branched-chain amino acid ABC transporter permease, partial [Oscillospiraceae bacterium]